MERNLIYALLASMAIIYLWNSVLFPKPPKPETAQVEVMKSETVSPKVPEKTAEAPKFDEEGAPAPTLLPRKEAVVASAADTEKANKPEDANAPKGSPVPSKPMDKTANPTPDAQAAVPAIQAAVEPAPKPEEHLVTIDTEDFKAQFTSYGARLKSFVLKNEKYSFKGSDGGRIPVDIVTVKESENLPYTLFLEGANFEYDPAMPFEIEASDAHSVSFKAVTPQGIIIRKRFALKDGYLFGLTVSVENGAGGEAVFFPKLRMVGFEDDSKVIKGFMGSAPVNQQIPKAFIDNKLWEETSKDDLLTTMVQKGQLSWTAIDDRYFLLSLLPPANQRSQIDVKTVKAVAVNAGGKESTQYWLAITHSLEKQQVAAGKVLDLDYDLYIGPKEYDSLKIIGRSLEESVDYWVLGFLAKPMLWVLKVSQKVVINWGIAIIILTIIVKLLLYPLTHKSFQSMQKMKDLKPKIDALKEKCGDNKQEFNQKMMELYKREGVNPLGGCLPILLQMPVYIALYKMLQSSVELFNSTFVPGWINDLAQPDPYYILPVLLAIMMYFQQKLTPTPDPQQQKIMLYMMPVMMLFFMLMLPSGLVLYIMASTLIGVGQQWWIMKKHDPKPAKARA